MNWISRILNPYGLLIIGVFIEYFPTYFEKAQPSINVGPVSLYITDISFLVLCAYVLIKLLRGVTQRREGRSIQIMFALFIAFSAIKWLLQTNHDIQSIRMLIKFTIAYALLFFFPMLVTRKVELKNLHYLLLIFLVYIFALHIYAFATQGFKSHILTGGFLTMLGLLYFLAMGRNHVLALPPMASFFVKALVITTFVMVGHRSGFVGILLGLIALSFFNKKSAIKEVAALMVVIVVGAGAAMILSPSLLSKFSDRASTTFDSSQETYQVRYDQYFVITRIAMEEHPVIGKPFESGAAERKRVTRESGGSFRTGTELVIAPHNLLLEWLYYYGSVGLVLGLTLVLMGAGFIRSFLAENKNDIQNYQMGVVMLCCMAHNLFFALTNVTVTSSFGTFFLYFPLAILVSINRNKKMFYKEKIETLPTRESETKVRSPHPQGFARSRVTAAGLNHRTAKVREAE